MAEADPSKMFNVHDAKTQLSKLIDRASAGEEIVLAKAGKPCARLMPLEQTAPKRRQPGRWKHMLGKIDNDELLAPCYTDEELDHFYNEDIDPRRR